MALAEMLIRQSKISENGVVSGADNTYNGRELPCFVRKGNAELKNWYS